MNPTLPFSIFKVTCVTGQKGGAEQSLRLIRLLGYRFRLEPRRFDARVLAISIPQRAESSNA
jgi:hypothetical protein